MSRAPGPAWAGPSPSDQGSGPTPSIRGSGPTPSIQAPDPGGMTIYSSETDDLLASQQRDPLLRYLTSRIVHHVSKALPAEARVLDVGCGVGRTSVALAKAGFDVQGVDPSPRVVELASSHAGLVLSGAQSSRGTIKVPRFAVGDATQAIPPEWRGQFDGVVCSEVIEHVDSPAAVVAYCADALRTGGWAVLTTPHQRSQWTAMDTYAGHVTRFEVAEVAVLLQGRFKIARLETEGFPFQRTAMKLYDASLKSGDRRHEYEGIRDRPAYRAYVRVMPWLLQVDHLLASLRRGTTIIAVAQRND